MKAVLLVSHGSRSRKTLREIQVLVNKLRKKSGLEIVEYAFLEIESPSIPEGIKKCVEKGAKDIIVLLNFLNAGQHVDQDIPQIIDEARQQYPDINFHVTAPVGQHSEMEALLLDILHRAL